MFVLPLARVKEPRARYELISSLVFTSTSVTPCKVISPLAVSLIIIGALDGFEASKSYI